jgi:type I restriction enzyme R subunit
VFKDKPGGMVVDYLGLADQLKLALKTYTESGGKGETAIDQEQAVAVMLEKYEVCRAIFGGFNWSVWQSAKPQQRLSILPAAQEHVLAQAHGKNRLINAVSELSKAFALAVPHERVIAIRDDVGFFQAAGAGGAHQGERRRASAQPGRDRPRHPADRLAGGVIGGRDRYLRGGRTQEAGHLDPVG